MFCLGDVCMHWCIGLGVRNSIDIMVEATAVNTIEFTCLESWHTSSSDVSSFLERLIIHLSWILEAVEEVKAVLKVLVFKLLDLGILVL